MRTIPFLGLAALATLAAVVAVAAPAFADPTGDLAVSGTTISVKNAGAFHLNNQFTWSIKDPSGKALKSTKISPDHFKFSGGTADHPTSVKVDIVPGTLKGGYCDNDPDKGGCHVFTATCTSSSCTVNAQ
jgi:hypothetical protein